jgi:drug/metabolite transporter (DMT)-like permease
MEVQSSAFIMLGAAIIYGIINAVSGFSAPENVKGICAVTMIVFVSTVFAFWAFFTGLERTGSSLSALVSILEPVVTVFSSILILSEKITANITIGGLFAIVSLLVILIPIERAE